MNLLKKTTVSAVSIAVLLGSFTTAVLAAGNPAGTGQPGTPTVSCGSVTSAGDATKQPKGFQTNGFLDTATVVYAGSAGTPSLQNGNVLAVSQYDIACYQYTASR